MPTQLRDDMRHTYQDFGNDADDWQQYAHRGADQLRDIVRDNTGRSMIVALAAGLGVGVLIGASLGGSRRSSRWIDRTTAEGVGRRLLDKMERLVPDAISDRFNT